MTQPSPSSTSSPSGAVEREAQQAYSRWAVDNEPQSFPAPHVVEHTSFVAGYRIATEAARIKTLATLNVGELVTALEEIKNLKAEPIGDTGFQVGPLALLQAAQRIARTAILRFRGASS